MKLIICGSRTIMPSANGNSEGVSLSVYGSDKQITYVSKPLMFQTLDKIVRTHFDPITEVVSGKAQGGDLFGELWAKSRNIPIKPFPVKPEEWQIIGKAAGHLRNRKMGDYIARTKDTDGAGVLAIWDGVSNGTRHMLDYAKELGIKRVVLDVYNGKLEYRVLG